jgi:hypothetical protein
MPLPEFNEVGDLPAGIHSASLEEVIDRFGASTDQRVAVTARLRKIYELALATGALDRLVVFGSYVSDVRDPNDVDIVLVMREEFNPVFCPVESLALFDHRRAQAVLGASVFWVRPAMLLGEPLDQFLGHWQRKRDGVLRGIVEVRP